MQVKLRLLNFDDDDVITALFCRIERVSCNHMMIFCSILQTLHTASSLGHPGGSVTGLERGNNRFYRDNGKSPFPLRKMRGFAR